jgi:hypothetical protein
MAEIARLNGGRIPQSKRDVDRLFERHPQLRRKVEEAMLRSMLEEGLDPFAEPPDAEEFPDLDDEPPSSPFWPPIGRRGRKKKKHRR